MDTLSEEMDDQVVAAVTTTQLEPDQLETLLRHLLSGPVVPAPPPEPVPSVLEQLLQKLLTEAQATQLTPPAQAGHSDIESLLWNLLPGTSAPAARAQQCPMRRNWNTVVCFSSGKAGHGATRCPNLNEAFPFMLPGWLAEKVGGNYALTDAGKVTVGVAGLAEAGMAFPADFAGVVAADVTALADAGMVTVGVTGLAEAGMAFPADFAGVVAADVTALADAGMVTVGVTDLATAGMVFPADFAGVVAADVATLAAARAVTLGVVSLADAGAGTVGVSDLADAGLALPADHAGAGTVGVSALADTDAGMALPADLAGVATVGVATLADAEMMFLADLAGAVTVSMAPMTVGGMTFPADPPGAVTVGVAGRADVVGVPKCGGGDVGWDDRLLPGNGRQGCGSSVCQLCRLCSDGDVCGVVPVAEYSGSLPTGSSDRSCPAVDYMTCWDKLEAMSDDSYDCYEGVDGQPGYFDCDDPGTTKSGALGMTLMKMRDITLRSHRMWWVFFFRPELLLR